MAEYTMKKYLSDIDKKGLKKTWHSILLNILNERMDSDLFVIDNFGEMQN